MIKNIVIYGYTTTAAELAKILTDKKIDFRLVCSDEREQNRAKEDGFEAAVVDLMVDEGLIEIGIDRDIDTFFCMHEAYHKNLFITLSARKLNANVKIISLASSANDESKMILAGANETVNPYDMGAHGIFRLLQKPRIFSVLDKIIYNYLEIKIAEITVPQSSSIIGEIFHKLTFEKEYSLIIIGIKVTGKYGKFYYNTHKIYHKIKSGDILVVVGEFKNIEKLQKGLKR